MSDKGKPGQPGGSNFSLGPRQPNDPTFVQPIRPAVTEERSVGPRQPSSPGGSVGPRQPQAPTSPANTGEQKGS